MNDIHELDHREDASLLRRVEEGGRIGEDVGSTIMRLRAELTVDKPRLTPYINGLATG